DPEIASQVADRLAPDFGSVRLRLPNIHCIACVWLLENLHRIRSGIGTCRVDFLRREVHIAFDPRAVSLAQIAATLASIGYPPDLRLSDLRGRMHASPHRRLWMKLGVAGFAFGNAMLLSFSHYLGLDALSAPDFQRLAAIVSFLLAIPVTFFCAEDYWKAAWISIRQRRLNLEVPIALGIAALFLQSAFDTWTGRGEGYFDSLAGLLFFLLIGRTFQTIIHDRLTFDRGLSDFLPLSSIRLRSDGSEETVAIDALNPGDMIRVRHGEWVPCDSTLAEGPGSFDLSFITGEANAAPIQRGEAVPAGARQVAGSVLLRVSKRVSQGYLASLWQQDAFRRERDDHARSATQRFSQRFTKIVLAVATVSGLFWSFQDPGMGLETFLAVLIVACPCALALAAPFALGTARRCLTQRGIHLRTVEVLETLAEVNTVVFDKTGTLTLSGAADVKWAGSQITPDIAKRIGLLASQSAHPLAVCIQGAIRNMGFDVAMNEGDRQAGLRVAEFREFTGLGIEAKVDGHKLRMGSARFVGKEPESRELEERQACVHVQIDGKQVGCFVAGLGLRPGVAEVLKALGKDRTTQLLSGDNDHDQDRFRRLFPPSSPLLFRQSPHSKLDHVRSLQAQGRTVMMVGDGLNDAGALRQSDVGVVVLDDLVRSVRPVI
ncbi:MAG: heavy metal translocating P-type ATPase, partial [Verrucomicrobia bacterium]|nr:heavy metal translocating P-type ATPase [Verrucomicrobiota bacterium]